MHDLTYIRIDQYRIRPRPDTVHHYRISAILLIQIPANVINHDKILMEPRIQMCNRFMQSHRMKMTLLCIGDQSFHIFQCTCDLCLTMAFQYRNIDQKINICRTFTDIQFHPPAISFNPLVFLHIPKRHLIPAFWIESAFASLLAVVVSISIQWVGILIINAMLVLPAAGARNIANNVKQYHLFSVLIAMFSGFLGLMLAYYFDMAAGATIVVISSVLFFLTLLLKPYFSR